MYVQIDEPYNSKGEKTYLNMGSDILDYLYSIDVEGLFRDKIVAIGSFTNDDIHTTYAGDIAGCVINYNVLTSLLKGQHKIPPTLLLVYFMIFFIMSFLVLSGASGKYQSMGWLWAKLFVLYSIVLTIVCVLVFMVWGQAHDVLITSSFFSCVDVCCKWNNKRKVQ
jgi:CHASE2 domain-containing sensor protein